MPKTGSVIVPPGGYWEQVLVRFESATAEDEELANVGFEATAAKVSLGVGRTAKRQVAKLGGGAAQCCLPWHHHHPAGPRQDQRPEGYHRMLDGPAGRADTPGEIAALVGILRGLSSALMCLRGTASYRCGDLRCLQENRAKS